jgi:para-aminobenzoate synthetase component 1
LRVNSLSPPSSSPRPSGLGPLVEELVPAPCPWEMFQRLGDMARPVFFDSALAHSTLGRYSFISADPFDWLWSRGRRVWLSSAGRVMEDADPLSVLAQRLAVYPGERVPGLPPFQGGAAGLLGYDLCQHLEKLPRPAFDEFEVPDMAVGFYDWVLAHDHQTGRAWLISTGLPEPEGRQRARRAEQRRADVKRRLLGPHGNGTTAKKIAGNRQALEVARLARQWPVPGLPHLTSNFDRARYLRAASQALDYIQAGDCFQVNLAQRLLAPCPDSPLELYGRLRERNPAPFASYFDLGEFIVASASPERFLRLDQMEIEARPIKGTRPRGTSPAEDEMRMNELLASGKDRAENVMIVDLLRNDLGRVCAYGSVRVPAVCRLESYPYVHHLVSEVRGRLREGLGPVDLLRAAFPGGSVTGAPKVRVMEIIAELEPTARGPYCGSLGYIGFDGTMDTNILIRTLTLGRGWVQFPVGGGIVADSVPEREYEETWHKAAGLLRALS